MKKDHIMTAEEEMMTYDFMDDDDGNWIHDEDSFYPNEIDDEERDVGYVEYETNDEEFEDDDEDDCDYDQIISDIINNTIDEMENAVGKRGKKVTISATTWKNALQLLKAYSYNYYLQYDEFYEDYDD